MKAKRKQKHKQRNRNEDSYLPSPSYAENFRNMHDIERKAYLYDCANRSYDQDKW